MLKNMMMVRWLNLYAWCLVAAVFGSLASSAGAQTVTIDAVSREFSFGLGVEPPDAVSREFSFYLGGFDRDAVSREFTFYLGGFDRDAVSREVTFYLEDPNGTRDVVSREFSAYILRTLDLPDHFVGAEMVTVPRTSIRWMSLAAPPTGSAFSWDLYAGVTTGLNGNEGDPSDDFLYRATREGIIEQFLAFPAADTDPIGLAFGPGGTSGTRLFVSANNLDGGQPGELGGAILAVDPSATVSVFAPLGPGLLEPQGLTARPSSSGDFPQLLYYAQAADPLAVGTIQANGSQGSWELSTATVGLQNCARFAPGGDFGNDLYLGGADGQIYRSDAAGVASVVTEPLGAEVQGLAFSNGYGFGEWLYVLLADGRIVRVAADGTVEPFLTGIAESANPNTPVRNDLCFTSAGDRLFLTDAVRKVIYQVRVEMPTGIQEEGPELPSVTALDRVYPNPFNPGTHIRFGVARAGRIGLRMYDIRGRMVRELVSGETLAAGIHDIYWDGKDSTGQGVASGVYFVRLEGDGRTSVQKVTLLK